MAEVVTDSRFRNPESLVLPADIPPHGRTILGLDFGSNLGWAFRKSARRMFSGIGDFTPTQHRGGGMRWILFRGFLVKTLTELEPAALAYELVVRTHASTQAAQVYGGFLAITMEECEARGIPYFPVNVTTVKRYATGKGNANKGAMKAAALERWGHAKELTEDEADARWIAETGAHVLGW